MRYTRRSGGSCTELELRPPDIRLFRPHPNLSDEINNNIAQSEVEGGVYLHNLRRGSSLEIQTRHRSYTMVNCGGGLALISGHPEFCPRPVLVRIMGSNWGGSMLKTSFIGRSMHLEFRHPKYRTPIVTSAIQEIREVSSRLLVFRSARRAAIMGRFRSFLHRVCTVALRRSQRPKPMPPITTLIPSRGYYQ